MSNGFEKEYKPNPENVKRCEKYTEIGRFVKEELT